MSAAASKTEKKQAVRGCVICGKEFAIESAKDVRCICPECAKRLKNLLYAEAPKAPAEHDQPHHSLSYEQYVEVIEMCRGNKRLLEYYLNKARNDKSLTLEDYVSLENLSLSTPDENGM